MLSGLAGALLAQGLDPARCRPAAAFLHGVAARRAAAGDPEVRRRRRERRTSTPVMPRLDGAPIGAADVVRALPDAIRAVRLCRA